jgi:ribonuclease P protein component
VLACGMVSSDEADVSAEEEEASAEARIPGADEHARRAESHQESQSKGEKAAGGPGRAEVGIAGDTPAESRVAEHGFFVARRTNRGMIEKSGIMAAIQGNRLPPRLRRKKEFHRVVRSGRRHRAGFLQIAVYPTRVQDPPGDAGASGRVGFVVPERVIKHASGRNRVRRLIREAVRVWWKDIRPGHDIVIHVIGKPAIDHAWYVEDVFLRLLVKAEMLSASGEARAKERMEVIKRELGRRAGGRK